MPEIIPYASSEVIKSKQFVLKALTTDNVQTEMLIDGTDRMLITPDTTWRFLASVTARRMDGVDNAGFLRAGVIVNNTGTTQLVGTVDTIGLDKTSDLLELWTVEIEADNTNEALKVLVKGRNGRTIRWGCVVAVTELRG